MTCIYCVSTKEGCQLHTGQFTIHGNLPPTPGRMRDRVFKALAILDAMTYFVQPDDDHLILRLTFKIQ